MFRRLWRRLLDALTARTARRTAQQVRRRLLPPSVQEPRPEPPAPEELEFLPPPSVQETEAPEVRPAPRRRWTNPFRRFYQIITRKPPADAPVRTHIDKPHFPVFTTPPRPPRSDLRRRLRVALRRTARQVKRAAKAAWRVANTPIWPRKATTAAEEVRPQTGAPVTPPAPSAAPPTAPPPPPTTPGGPFGLPFGRHLSNIQKAFIERLTKLLLGFALASKALNRIADGYQRFAPTAALIERRRELHDLRRALRIDQAIGPHLNRISQNIEKILDVLVDTLIPLLEAVAPLIEAVTWLMARIAEASRMLAFGVHLLRWIMTFLKSVFGGSKDEPAPMSKVLRDYMAFVAPAPPPGPIIP